MEQTTWIGKRHTEPSNSPRSLAAFETGPNPGTQPEIDTPPLPDKPASSSKTYPLHMHIAFIYVLLTVILLSAIGLYNYWEANKNLVISTHQMFTNISDGIKPRIHNLQSDSTSIIGNLLQAPFIESGDFAEQIKAIPLMAGMLNHNPGIDTIIAARDNGAFCMIGNWRITSIRGYPPQSQNVQYFARVYDGASEKQRIQYLDSDLNVVEQREIPAPDGYDPREKEWYQLAMATESIISTKPYSLHSGTGIGKAVAQKSKEGDMVVVVIFGLEGIDAFLDSIKPTPSSELLVFDNNDTVFYYSKLKIAVKETPTGDSSLFKLSEVDYPSYEAVKKTIASGRLETPFTVKANDGEFITLVTELMDSAVTGTEYYVAFSTPKSEILPDLSHLMHRQGMFTLLAFTFALPISWFFSRKLSKDLQSLSGMATDMRNFYFPKTTARGSSISEFNDLSLGMHHTNFTLRRFLEISTAISTERDYSTLLNTILHKTMDIVTADVGILYLMSGDNTSFEAGAARFADGIQSDGGELLFSLASASVNANRQKPFMLSAEEGISQRRDVKRSDWDSDLMRELFSDEQMQFISVPLSSHTGGVLGVLCLYCRQPLDASSNDLLSFIRQLSAGAAVAIENHRLLNEQKHLFDSFVRLIAGAVDLKSNHTGRHCQRVPVIARMLAQAADQASEGVFAHYHLEEKNREALRLASWLHDCGKIITPDHVIDKGTKLETVYNRIHEVRMRFEVLKRDAEIQYYRLLFQGADEPSAKAELSEELKRLDDDFAFVSECNIGNEAMQPESVQRLQEISKRTWQRTISDQLGISEAERKRKGLVSNIALPATEYLLANKQEHLIADDIVDWTATEEAWGFTLKAPKFKYNLGEITNLSIFRGTLTAEERYLIDKHAVQTILMLSHLPFPEEYGDVVEIAGSHHEKVNAEGYPRGLSKDEMSIEARILAIADVFEALTSADRPYKKANMLSEALVIMSNMVKFGHLDKELFEIFIHAEVYKPYAMLYLKTCQIDKIDREAILSRE